jgi:hypothetical protein
MKQLTPRQRLANILMASALRNEFKNKAEFRRSAVATLGCLNDPQNAAEADRLDNIALGISRLI